MIYFCGPLSSRHHLDSERTYAQKVRGTQAADLIGYWPMNEPSGSTALDKSAQGNDGSYTGVTLGQTGIGDGLTCPLFDGTNDFCDIYSAAFNTDWDGAEYTVSCWAKVDSAANWSEGAQRQIFTLFGNANDSVYIFKGAGNPDAIILRAENGNTPYTQTQDDLTTTDWFHVAVTLSELGDEVIFYYNGSQVDSDSSLGSWTAALNSDLTNIGCYDNSSPNNVWHGLLAHCAVWTTPLTAEEIAELATV